MRERTRYGRQRGFTFFLYTSDGTAFKTDAVFAAGQAQVSISGGAFANVNALPTNLGGGAYRWVPSLAELQGGTIAVKFTPTGALPAHLVIETENDPRAQNLGIGVILGTTISSVVGSTGILAAGTGLPSSIPKGTVLIADNGVAGIVQSYNSGTRAVTMTQPWSGAIADGTEVIGIANPPDADSSNLTVGLSAAAIAAIWNTLTSALTTGGSIGKLLVDQLNATILSRASAADYTAARAGKLDFLDAAISSRSSFNSGTQTVQVGDKTGFALSGTGVDAIVTSMLAKAIGVGVTVEMALKQGMFRGAIIGNQLIYFDPDGVTPMRTYNVTFDANGNLVSQTPV